MDNNIAAVIKILDPEAKRGISQKTGKAWSMARVELSNGEGVFIFNPVEVGDAVEKIKNGEFENWQKKRIDPKHDEIVGKLDQILKILTNDTVVEPVDDQFAGLEPPGDI